MAAKAVAAAVNWASVSSKLKPETVAALNAFRRRHTDLTKQVTELREAQVTIDFEAYRRVLKNKKVVSEAEKAFKNFSPATIDLSEQLKNIEKQEVLAIAAAQNTVQKVTVELDELNDLLTNIETARPVEQLTVEDVAKAMPDLDATVEKMAKRGQWRVPGYYEKFGEFQVGF
ncbi:hypothetical protein SmJEL517_g05151 [Synchytrium microbalum]|uniref:ATP synthase subunit d, mitochondrial n=1 Tax=Synchytrium microbalum TaxID=1806994 RepID=A0A507C207_9FUNG|nr:uncharacterized protein SmJEL517_g05151 [Synchytrium microbalum]TPX31533.1 hypothetical protein SmJEL517_g05151 [Synchytrium microbalum]